MLYRWCNALVIAVLLLGPLPPAQNFSPRFEPPIQAQEGATTQATWAPGGSVSGRLVVTKRAEPGEVSPGDLITYTIALTNTTEAAMEGLVVSDTLPDGLAYVPGSADDGIYDPRTNTLTWDIRELAAGASLSLAFQARVRGDVLDDLIVNVAEVRGDDLARPVQARATVAVARQVVITPQGGVLETPSGRLRVESPPRGGGP